MLHVDTFTLGMFEVHNYLLYDTDTREAVLFDTGENPTAIIETIRQKGLDLKLILYTHTHIDHIEGHSVIREAYPDVPAWAHAEEKFWLDAIPMQAQMFNMETPTAPVITGFLQPGQVFAFTHFTVEARFSPGHSPGGMVFYVKEGPFLFTGDVLFAGTIGRTDFPKGDFDTLMNAIASQILTLPDETAVYPGHGPITSIGTERQHNPFILDYLSHTRA